MYEAASLSQIKSKLSSELPRKVVITRKEPIHEMSFMVPGMPSRPTRYKVVSHSEERRTKLIGILLCHPQSPLAKSEIIGHLPYFHIRSGEAIDFFCAGYGAYWPPGHHTDQNVVAHINNEDWLFSNEAFLQVIEDLEQETRWQYSGETELLLIPAKKDTNKSLELQYKSAIVCNLEGMAKDGAFSSVRAFFDGIFRHSKSSNAANTAWDLSDKKGIEVARDALTDFVISLLPEKLRSGYKRASHYAIKNIETDF